MAIEFDTGSLDELEFERFLNEYQPIERKSPEFRLYYNEDGSIICYSCEKLEGKYLVIDPQTYAECRQNVMVVDGKIETIKPLLMVQKLVESIQGTMCAVEDINIVVPSDYTGKTSKWEMRKYEFKNS
jgi:hypothetical protein